MLEFDTADEAAIRRALQDVKDQWQQLKGAEFSSGVATNSQGTRQIKIYLRSDSFIIFEHCDAAIRNAAVLHMRKASLQPINTWFLELEGQSHQR